MKVTIRLLGDLEVAVDGRQLDLADMPRRSRELLELVALARGKRVNRHQVIEQLFGHLDPEAGAANLHKAASLARRHLGSAEAVTIKEGWIGLWPAATVETDAERFEARAEAALASGDPDQCRRAADEYRGELLPTSLHEEWAQEPRRRLAQLFTRLLRAGNDWERLSDTDPTDEEAARHLMVSAAASGDRAQVVKRYRRLREGLARGLEMPPSPETVELYDQLTRGPAATAPVGPSRPLVGREVVLKRAMTVMNQTEEGSGGGLLVTGEHGIGKTRMAEELLTRAADGGWSTLRGSSAHSGADIPFLPVAEAIDRLVMARPDLVDRLPGPARAALARVTVASLRITDPAPARFGPQEVISAVARLVAAAARERPVMVLFDDLHTADADTVRLVHHLMRSAIFQPVLVVATARVTTTTMRDTRSELLASGRVSEIELGPLSREEAGLLVGDAVDERALHELWERTGGNPFLLGEMAEYAMPEGGLPPSVAAVVKHRVDRLPNRAALERAAVIDGFFTGDELSALSGLAGPEAAEMVDHLITEGLLDETRGTLRFRHPLVREALLEQLSDHRRSTAHVAVAEMLEEAGAAPARVAHHMWEGGRQDRAVGWLLQAARAAISVGAYSDARGFIEKGLSATPRDPELLSIRAELAFATAEPDAPRRYTEAIAAAPSDMAGPLLVRRARAYIAANDPRSAADSMEAVMDDVGDDRALLRLVQAQLAWMMGDLENAQAAAEEARLTALGRGQMDVVMGAVSLLDLVAHQQGGWTDRLLHDLVAAKDSPVMATVLYDAHLCGAEAYLYGGRPFSEVADFARDLSDHARKGGAKRGLAFAETLLGEVELLSGDLEIAQRHLREGAELHRQVGAHGGEALAKQRLAQAMLAQQASVDVTPLLSEAMALASASGPMAWHVVARVYATMVEATPQPDMIKTVVDQAEAEVGGGMAQTCPPCTVPYWISAAVACADGGDSARAGQFVARAEPWVAMVWPQGGWAAALNEAHAHIALANHEPDTARTLLEQASHDFERIGQRLDLARCTATLETMS